ncbi:hypothetical protein Pla163_34140 [Planctomycetes bacterium Pla163]|uniref:AlgX/AlgJ SGNH hydrolase-like domain-containing protein n=1 Tax=Rohdeia mirabilis TaxID=2528008 RepID=A0A518D455_9BACT|nr:hypothetical protein Pla163_34140 [Planctomycetes bacterium Pla163]
MTDSSPQFGGDPSGGDPPTDEFAQLDAERSFMLKRILHILLGLFVGFAAVDAVVAQVDASENEAEMELGHPLLSWTNTVDYHDPVLDRHHDRYGLRNREIEADADPTEVRIAGFGESRIYGAGEGVAQDDVWNHALERLLNANRRVPVRVLNGGVMGYSVAQSCRRAVLLLDALEPDLVFVTVAATPQALIEDPDLGGFVEVDGRFVSRAMAARWPEPLLPLVALGDAVLGRWSAIYTRHKNREVMQGDLPPFFLRWRYFGDPKGRDYLERCLQATWDSVSDLRTACEERGIELRFAILPDTEVATAERWKEWLQKNGSLWGLPADTQPERSIDALEAKLNGLGVETWNMTPEVKGMGKYFFQHYIRDDVHHWTPKGHQRVAEGLMRWLLKDGLLKRLTTERAANPRTQPFGPPPR